jgi:dCMP deaminase
MKLPWSERMYRLAEQWSEYSSCVRRKVGAVIYDPESYAIVSIGYNDTPIGAVDCGDGGCQRCQTGPNPHDIGGRTRLYLDCRCVHAEMNAILLAARFGRSLKGMVVMSTEPPCDSCLKHFVQAGLTWLPSDTQLAAGGWDERHWNG